MINPREVASVADAKAIVEARNIDYVKIGLHDVDGVMRCTGHCGPIVRHGCQTFFWGRARDSNLHVLNWRSCNVETCQGYCDDNPGECFTHDTSPSMTCDDPEVGAEPHAVPDHRQGEGVSTRTSGGFGDSRRHGGLPDAAFAGDDDEPLVQHENEARAGRWGRRITRSIERRSADRLRVKRRNGRSNGRT